jgi:hypothetical protein
MMKRRIKVKANAMEDVDVHFVSLVNRPASRLPFRALKSDDPDQESKPMIDLARMFKRDGSKTNATCKLAGVVVQKEHKAHFEPQLKELGLKTDDVVEADGVVIFRQCDYETADVVAIKLNEVGGLFLNAPESVTKAYDPWPESDNFSENMSAAGFLPGMSFATEMLMETVRNVLRSSDSPDSARNGLNQTLDAYKNAVMEMANNLPEIAFKMEALSLDGFSPEVLAEIVEAPVVDMTGEGDAVVEKQEGAEGDKPAAASADPEAGLSDEDKLKLKGVHIEDLDVQPVAADPVASKEPAVDPAAPVEKSAESELDLAGLLASFKSEVLEAVSGVRSEVEALKQSQGELTDKVKSAEEVAEAARKAVKGIVPSNSDAGDRIPDESLGTRRRNRKSDGDNDESAWGGTALDRIVGDFR